MPEMGLIGKTEPAALAAYLALWGLFTLVMFIGTLRLNRALMFVFASLTVLFALLAVGHAFDAPGVLKLAGYEGIVCGA